MIVKFLLEMAQEVFKLGRHKHDKTKNSYKVYCYDNEGNLGNTDKNKEMPSLEAVHVHVSFTKGSLKSQAKYWILPEEIIVVEDYLEDSTYVQQEVKKRRQEIIKQWSSYFGAKNTRFYETDKSAKNAKTKKRNKNKK